jgi:hypothetical protein
MPRMIPRLLLVLCLAGNVLLVVALMRRGAPPTSSSSPDSDPVTKLFHSQKNIPAAAPSTAAAADTFVVTNGADFSWAQFTASDFARYIKQLRAIGTPEPQVREIVMGAIDAIYRPRRAALMSPPKKRDDSKFWVRSNPWRSQSQRSQEQRDQMRALRKEEAELVKSLFGADVYDRMAQESGNDTGVDWMERQYGFIPKELREQVQDIESRMNDETQQVYADAQENNDWQYQQVDLRKIEKKYRAELAKILTPEQLQEWDLRHSQNANDLKNNLSAFDPKEDEFRAIFKYKQTMDEVNPPRDPDADPVKLTAEERKANAEKQKAADAELASLIGTNRVAEYKLEQDYGYRSLIEGGVAKESVFKLDDMKKVAQDAANKIKRDKTLSPDQRNEALAAIRNETQSGINDLLGDKFGKKYLNQNGWWLNNIAPKPQPAPTQ